MSTSCSNESEQNGLVISKGVITLNNDGGDESITFSSDDWWLVASVEINSERIYIVDNSAFTVEKGVLNKHGEEIALIKNDWFSVSKIDPTSLDISVLPNKDGEDRSFSIYVSTGNTGKSIRIEQSSDD